MSIRSVARSVVNTGLRSGLLVSELSRLSRAGLLPSPIVERLPGADQVLNFTLPNDARLTYRSTRGDWVGRALLWHGWDGFESETAPIFYELALTARTVIDVGANTGYFTLLALAANRNSRVIAFEPNPSVHVRLARNVAANGWTKRCELRHEAVAEKSGTGVLHVPSGNVPSMSTLAAQQGLASIHHSLEVSTTTLDAACSHLAEIDLVKIDVEGLEEKVLLGMMNIIERDLPHIIVECIHDVHGNHPDLSSILSGYRYRFFHLLPNGPIEVDAITPDPDDKNRNFLCAGPGSSLMQNMGTV